MSGEGEPTRIVPPRDRELRARFYRALAREIIAAPAPAAAVLETASDRPATELAVRPASVIDALAATPAFARLEPATPGRSVHDPPPSRTPAVAWAAVPLGRGLPSGGAAGPRDLPDWAALLGPTGRLEVQTFWLGGRTDGRLWVARRARWSGGPPDRLDRAGPAIAASVAAEWSRGTGVVCRPCRIAPDGRTWATAAPSSVPRAGWLPIAPALADRSAEPVGLGQPDPGPADDGHAVVLGASGAGKTTFLAARAAEAIRGGGAVLAVDTHGDLAPAIVARLGDRDRERLVAVDAGRRPVVGVAALADRSDRAAVQFVAAVKRLSPDGQDLYWGFRLERIFDAFVRLVQETGGSLADLYALLTDADRRDVARLATRDPRLVRFLDELGPVVRRNPEFLWAAAARLAKVALVPALGELLSPTDGGIPVEALLEAGRPVLVRVPFATLGPEAAAFAGSLVLARAYLGTVARRVPGAVHPPVVLVLDEVQGFSPRLVTEILTEGRKFGIRILLASQYPERLAPELRSAAAGASRGVVAFRVPRASAAAVGAWIGLGPADAERVLSDLPTGLGVGRSRGAGELTSVATGTRAPPGGTEGWDEATRRTLAEFPPAPVEDLRSGDEATEQLLLAILSREERGEPVAPSELVTEAAAAAGSPLDGAVLDDRVGALEREGLARIVNGAWHLSPAGERRLGLSAATGASRESAEHRALLLRAFRLFARHGHRLEIVRQGRYDTTLPDAVYRQLPARYRSAPPPVLRAALATAERGWAWGFFGGRDVHVEAEVSGALRPARIRHGLEKAAAHGAYALFVVGDAGRADKVRRALRASGAGRDRAQVWTLGARRPATAPADRMADERSPGA